ncbi:ADP-ribose pyrophosphatase [Thermoplasmatales archaeon SCGC AB-539-C06]|nr:ADP-ribose pyrophosphatase [Thermoplasmatales archaeon SCGC AB-539-C06]
MEVLQSKELLTTPFFKVLKGTVDLNKSKIDYWRLERPSISVILSFFDGKIVMIKQYRYAIKQTSLELPAGLIKLGETPEECAKRELKEETGFTAKNIKRVLSYYPSNSISNQQVHLCVADNLTEGKSKREEDEIISDVILMSKPEIINKYWMEPLLMGEQYAA